MVSSEDVEKYHISLTSTNLFSLSLLSLSTRCKEVEILRGNPLFSEFRRRPIAVRIAAHTSAMVTRAATAAAFLSTPLAAPASHSTRSSAAQWDPAPASLGFKSSGFWSSRGLAASGRSVAAVGECRLSTHFKLHLLKHGQVVVHFVPWGVHHLGRAISCDWFPGGVELCGGR
jgi:hypothetical protein